MAVMSHFVRIEYAALYFDMVRLYLLLSFSSISADDNVLHTWSKIQFDRNKCLKIKEKELLFFRFLSEIGLDDEICIRNVRLESFDMIVCYTKNVLFQLSDILNDCVKKRGRGRREEERQHNQKRDWNYSKTNVFPPRCVSCISLLFSLCVSRLP